MKSPELVKAIEQHNTVTFYYDSLVRTVEPYTYGTHIDTGNEVLSAYQIGGFSKSNASPAWRLYRLDEISNLHILAGTFSPSRPGYNPNDKRMGQIYARA